jgi:hypothetical protein
MVPELKQIRGWASSFPFPKAPDIEGKAFVLSQYQSSGYREHLQLLCLQCTCYENDRPALLTCGSTIFREERSHNNQLDLITI